MTNFVDLKNISVLAPNFKKRLSGVTSTIIQLIPAQRKLGVKIAAIGQGLPQELPHIKYFDLWKLWQKPDDGDYRIWHARRNIEMLPGIIMRDILRMKIKLVFTSAAQRDHTYYTKWLISKMDKVIATSKKSANYLKIDSTIIHHGVDLERFNLSNDKALEKNELGLDSTKKYIGCFGRIRHQKGTDLFVDTMIEVLPRHPGWIAVITGRVTSEHNQFIDSIKQRIAQAGLEEQILYVGEVQLIEKWFRILDLYLAPQRWEGFGLTPLEAAASGVPSVATDVGAFSELIIEGKTGYVVEPENLQKLIEKTDNYLTDDKLLSESGIAARLHVSENFSLEKEANAINQTYRSIQ